ncbi:MAG: PEP-CTERM sorting domain-containing protein [Sedimentisphaerales bacterium]|jgi:hypothetical protein
MKKAFFSVAVLALLLTSQAWGITYTAIDLTPGGGLFDSSYGRGISGTQQVGNGGGLAFPNHGTHALLWNGSAASYVDLNPSGFSSGFSVSYARGISGTQQVGDGHGPATGAGSPEHALLWNGSAASYVDLNPSGFLSSHAYGTNGTYQVGNGQGPAGGYNNEHALLWNGSAASCVDLNPGGFSASYGRGISGSQQVGYGTAANGNTHALLWTGTPESYVDLNPGGFTTSYAYGINGAYQAGYGSGSATGGKDHALLWEGIASSCVDLNPDGFITSYVAGINGTQQVGYGTAANGNTHALLWNGSCDGVIDLHQFLPANLSGTLSYATGIDGYGNIIGYVSSGDYTRAVLWQPIPEPATLLLLGLGAAIAIRKQTRSKATSPLRK